MRYYVLFLLVLISFAVLGVILADPFFNYSFSLLKKESVTFEVSVQSGLKRRTTLMVAAMMAIPSLVLLVKKAVSLRTWTHSIISMLLIVLLGLVFWSIRIFGLNNELETLTEYSDITGVIPTLVLDYFEFEVYLLLGFIVGALIAILIFRDRSKPLIN